MSLLWHSATNCFLQEHWQTYGIHHLYYKCLTRCCLTYFKENEAVLLDVITWVKNGANCLPLTLKRLEEVIPNEQIHRKIAVDDHSVDNTGKILKDFNWEVYPNPETGISCGANYALSKVDCPFFMSFEQDLFLAKDWWIKISPFLDDPDTSVVSGVRLSTSPKAVRDLEKYALMVYLKEKKESRLLSTRRISAFTSGKTIDNTLFRTGVMRKVGGFPYRRSSAGVDTLLAFILNFHGFKWQVNPSCVSQHIRTGLKQEFAHQRWYASSSQETRMLIRSQGLDVGNKLGSNLTFGQAVIRLLISPFVGVFLTYKTVNPTLTMLHPLMKLLGTIGYIEGRG